MLGLDPAWIALIGTVFGGVGFKIIEALLGRTGVKDTTATNLRSELRTDLTAIKTELEKLRKEARELDHEVDQWRTKYFSLVASIAQGDLEGALSKITEHRE